MRIAPATPLITRSHSPQRGELAWRYIASYSCTLIAIAGAQLIIPNQLAALLALVTLVGLPISLYLRRSNLRVFGVRIPRFIINSTLVAVSGFFCFYLLLLLQPDLLERGAYNTLIVTTRSAGESIAILMNMFLVFAAIRSLAIINDKDAVLSAVPSFSVLLLLIVVHRGPQVVAYFLLWAIAAAILFSLDHRAESRHNISGVVPSLVPGQEMRLSARGLASVMSFSLLCAVTISYYLSSRNPEERGYLESWIMGMASHMTQLALNLPEVSVNSGPERQIDYSSGPALPTRTELWNVTASTLDGELIRPNYWRMFSLSQYNGSSWSQIPGSGTMISLKPLDIQRWPPFSWQGQGQGQRRRDFSGSSQQINPGMSNAQTPTFENGRRREGRSSDDASSQRPRPENLRPEGLRRRRRDTLLNSPNPAVLLPSLPAPQGSRNLPNATIPMPRADNIPSNSARGNVPNSGRVNQGNTGQMGFSLRRRGYDVAQQHPFASRILQSFGAPRRPVLQRLEARVPNVGFVPALPGISIFRIRSEKPPSSVRVRQDGAIDAGVIEPGQSTLILSDVAPTDSYGTVPGQHEGPPSYTSQRPNPAATLSTGERRLNLALPARLTKPDSRLRRYARQVLADAPKNESNFRRARRLALAIQQGAVYTLRPPQIPEGADAAEYFLFESRRGYCTYFAGALTVLCRSAGIPARVVSGFVNPDWAAGGGQIGVLREANAHAWTEVWVDGWGWAVVDATPAGDRGENAPEWWENWNDLFASSLEMLRQWAGANKLLLMVSWLILLPLTLLLALRSGAIDPLLARLSTLLPGRVQLSQDQSRRLIEKSYFRAMRKLARKFRRRISWETPHEYLAAAEATLNLENPAPLRDLTALYARAEYSPEKISAADGQRAYQLLRELSFRKRRAPSRLPSEIKA